MKIKKAAGGGRMNKQIEVIAILVALVSICIVIAQNKLQINRDKP